MAREREELPVASREVNSRDVQLVLSQLEGMTCPVDDCEGVRLVTAKSHASWLDLLDEPMVLSQNETAYRLLLSGAGEVIGVRIERTGKRTMLVVKVARGDHSWQPTIQTIRRRSRALSEGEWDRLSNALHEYGFWVRPSFEKQPQPWTDERGVIHGASRTMDGVRLSLEGVNSGRRHFVVRVLSEPEPGLKEFVSVVRELASCNASHGQ